MLEAGIGEHVSDREIKSRELRTSEIEIREELGIKLCFQVSQWERPDDYVPPRTAAEEAEAPAAEEAEARAAEEPETRGRSDTEHHHHTKHRPRALPGLAKADSRLALPAVRAPCAWEARHDPNHDATYYYNATTGESTWEKPADFDE